MAVTPYPVNYDIQRPDRYNRLTVLVRIILVIPQYVILFGFPFVLFTMGMESDNPMRVLLSLLEYVSLTMVLNLLVFLAWFAILFSGRFPEGFLKPSLSIFRWEQNVLAYMLLLTADYPPFGAGPYAVQLQIDPPGERNRLTTFFRFLLAIPHFIILAFLDFALEIITVIAWFAILFTGQYPRAMYDFSLGVVRWLLLRASPPICTYSSMSIHAFSLSSEQGGALTAELA